MAVRKLGVYAERFMYRCNLCQIWSTLSKMALASILCHVTAGMQNGCT